MSRTAKTIERGRPHIPHEDTEAPGTCVHCHRALGTTNDMHVDQLPAVDPAISADERRRYGERD